MNIRRLARTDLNLLVALHVLLEECNVTRAAERLYISQSAMSRILGKLRNLFDDLLFIRVGHGLTPSPRALELQEMLRHFLENAEALISPREFEPACYHGEMRIATSEMIGTAILPKLVESLAHEAPHLRVSAISRVEHQLEKLATGELDAAIHPRLASYGPDLSVDLLVSWPPVLVVRKDHPLTRISTLSSDEGKALIQRYPRVILCMQDVEWFVSRWGADFKNMVESMQVAVETSNLVSALEIVKRTDYIFYSSPYICTHSLLGDELRTVEFPYTDKEVGEYVLVMHRRVQNSLPHQWLRGKIREVTKHLKAGTPAEKT